MRDTKNIENWLERIVTPGHFHNFWMANKKEAILNGLLKEQIIKNNQGG